MSVCGCDCLQRILKISQDRERMKRYEAPHHDKGKEKGIRGEHQEGTADAMTQRGALSMDKRKLSDALQIHAVLEQHTNKYSYERIHMHTTHVCIHERETRTYASFGREAALERCYILRFIQAPTKAEYARAHTYSCQRRIAIRSTTIP